VKQTSVAEAAFCLQQFGPTEVGPFPSSQFFLEKIQWDDGPFVRLLAMRR
jgi:hypothetical protein